MDEQKTRLEMNKMKNNHFRNLVSIQTDEVDEGYAKSSIQIEEKHLQPANMVHGGVISTLIDCVIGSAVRSVSKENQLAVTLELNINYFRPVSQGTIYGESNIINKSKSVIAGDARITDHHGKLVAFGKATYLIKERTNKK